MTILKRLNYLVYVLLFLIISTLLFYVKIQQKKIDKLDTQVAELDAKLKSQLSIDGTKVVYKWRTKEGKVQEKIKYVPVEGKVVVVNSTQTYKIAYNHFTHVAMTNPETGDTILIQRAGLCFRPALAALVATSINAGLQARLAYFNRYGIGVGLSSEKAGYVFIDRRVDDFVPIFRNSTIGIYYGKTVEVKDVFGAQFALFF